MIRFKNRCMLLWCLVLMIISTIYSINFLLLHNRQHNNHKNKINKSIVDQFKNQSDKDELNKFDEKLKYNHENIVHSITAIPSNKKKKKLSKWKHYQLDRSLLFNNQTSWTKLWFMSNGTIKPSGVYSSELAIWPEDINEDDEDPSAMNDRIVNQLMYIPEGYDPKKMPLKKILLMNGRRRWNDLVLGRKRFQQDNCPVDACYIMAENRLIDKADAVIFKDSFAWPKQGRSSFKQLWILFLLESPYNTQSFSSLPSNVFNWTATYRHDSDIVAPYEKFVSYNSLIPDSDYDKNYFDNNEPIKNYAEGKTKKVAWFVSNCGAKNQRLKYAKELSQFIEVDIYGSCGKHRCPRTKAKECFEMLNRDYKFYLAFENSNCRDYITEKFFVNGLGHNYDNLNIVPIVMGAHPIDYLRAAPPNSYIHIDDFDSPAHLASYLHQLDQDDQAYNRFFQWKSIIRKGEFINTYFWCRLCSMLHANDVRPKKKISYENIAEWWAPKNICREGSFHWK